MDEGTDDTNEWRLMVCGADEGFDRVGLDHGVAHIWITKWIKEAAVASQ